MIQIETAIDQNSLIFLKLADFIPFQGNLKELSTEAYEKLKKVILKLKFSFVIHVWLHDGHYYILDGHQRVRCLQQMETEGYSVPRLPAIIVEAASFEEAKEKVLAGTSSYGDITQDGLYEFISIGNLKLDDVVSQFKFQEIDFERFRLNYYADTAEVSFNAKLGGDDEEKPKVFNHVCPKCMHEFD